MDITQREEHLSGGVCTHLGDLFIKITFQTCCFFVCLFFLFWGTHFRERLMNFSLVSGELANSPPAPSVWTHSFPMRNLEASVPQSWIGSGRRYRRWPAAWSWLVALQRCGLWPPSARGPSVGEMTGNGGKSVSCKSATVATTSRVLRSRGPGANTRQPGQLSWWRGAKDAESVGTRDPQMVESVGCAHRSGGEFRPKQLKSTCTQTRAVPYFLLFKQWPLLTACCYNCCITPKPPVQPPPPGSVSQVPQQPKR